MGILGPGPWVLALLQRPAPTCSSTAGFIPSVVTQLPPTIPPPVQVGIRLQDRQQGPRSKAAPIRQPSSFGPRQPGNMTLHTTRSSWVPEKAHGPSLPLVNCPC